VKSEKRRRQDGFTLLELIVVLFLIILIAGLAGVFFANNLSSSRLSATARELSATIRYARSLAQIRGERQTVTLDLDARVYTMTARGTRTIPAGITVKVIDPLLGEVHRDKYEIVLNDSGGVEGGTVVLSDGKRSMSIQPDPIVGTVIVK
jgi:type II secretion system protein H